MFMLLFHFSSFNPMNAIFYFTNLLKDSTLRLLCLKRVLLCFLSLYHCRSCRKSLSRSTVCSSFQRQKYWLCLASGLRSFSGHMPTVFSRLHLKHFLEVLPFRLPLKTACLLLEFHGKTKPCRTLQ